MDIDGQAQVWVFTAYGGNLRGGHYPNADGDPGRFEYLGDRIYGDFTADPYEQDPQQMVTVQRTYLSPWAHMEAGGFEPVYYHADHLGTTRLLSQQGQGGFNVLSHVYTAFGEAESLPENPPADAATRYGYVGAYGYESGLLTFTGAEDTFPIMLQHVGERWYDPAIGRFLQRDPIGIRGGVNVYAYVGSRPTAIVDPGGLVPPEGVNWPPAPSPPTPPRPKPPLTPEQELERLKKEYKMLRTGVHCTGAGVGAMIGSVAGPLGTLAGASAGALIGWLCGEAAEFIDEAFHPNEPENPIYGGDYSKW